MCGRYTLRTSAAELVEIFKVVREADSSSRYNIAPTQAVAVIQQTAKECQRHRVITMPNRRMGTAARDLVT